MGGTAEELEFIVKALCKACHFIQLFKLCLFDGAIRKTTHIVLRKLLQKGSILFSISDDIPLLVHSKDVILESNKIIKLRCIHIDTQYEEQIALWRLKRISNCFEVNHPYITTPVYGQYVTWSGWWSNNKDKEHDWELIDSKHIRRCSIYTVVKYEGNIRMVPVNEWRNLAICCTNISSERLLATLRQLRVGDVFRSKEALFGISVKKSGLQLYTLFAVPHGKKFFCMAHCKLDVNTWEPTMFRCGSEHNTSLIGQMIQAHDTHHRVSSLPPSAFSEISEFSIVSNGNGHYNVLTKSSPIDALLHKFVCMKTDPCRTIFEVTKTLVLSVDMKIVRITDTETSIEHLIPVHLLKEQFYIESSREVLKERVSKLKATCMRELSALYPGDVVRLTAHEHFMRVTLMKTCPTGKTQFRCKSIMDNTCFDFIELDCSNVSWVVRATDIEALHIKSQGTEVRLGDLVCISRKVTDINPNSAGLYTVSRITSDPKADSERETITLAVQLPDGTIIEVLETRLGKIRGIIHNVNESLTQCFQHESIVKRGKKRRKL